MTLTKKEIRALASRLAKADDELQGAIATLNEDQCIVGYSLSGTSFTFTGPTLSRTLSSPTLPPSMAAKNALLRIEAEIADIKQIMQAAGESEAKR